MSQKFQSMTEIVALFLVITFILTFDWRPAECDHIYTQQRQHHAPLVVPASDLQHYRREWSPQIPTRDEADSRGFPTQPSLLSKMGLWPRYVNLPSRSKVSETIGALNVLGGYFLRKTVLAAPYQNVEQHEKITQNIPENEDEEEDEDPLSAELSEQQNVVTQAPVLTVRPEHDEKLRQTLYTLGRNVLGQNVTDSLVPVVQTVNQIGKFLPPLVYHDGRIILGSGANSTKDGGPIRDVVCTTPSGGPGKCLDLSGCPSLLFDLNNLRKSLCFKALFVPGVCCADEVNQNLNPSQTLVTKRPAPIPKPTTAKPNQIVTRTPIPTNDVRVPPTFETPVKSPSDDEQCGQFEEPSFRIVGGAKSVPASWPWMAAIFLHGPKGTEFWCGGTLISKQYILTAAHCTKDQKQKSFTPRQFSVRLGDYDLVKTDDFAEPAVFRVAEIIPHPDFSGMGFYNDVALLRLDRDVTYSRFIKPICLPTGPAARNTFVGTFATVIGWGTDKYGGRENNALQEVKLPVWSNAECDKTYFQPITDIFLCAGLPSGGKDACQGDSGGPLMLELETGRWTQIGIVSFGNRCAEPGYPGVYTRLTKFTSWIKDNAI